MISKKTQEKIYDDAMSGALKEVGTGLSSVTRFLLSPLKILETAQPRIDEMFLRIGERVPEEGRVEAPPELVGPILEKIKYLPEKSELWEMFEELLTKAVDKNKFQSVHPAFVQIISQLSPDEAILIKKLKNASYKNIYKFFGQKTITRQELINNEIPISKLNFPDNLELYISHLESLSLVVWQMEEDEPIVVNDNYLGFKGTKVLKLTSFGEMFAEACVSENGLGNH
jgi:hypothetical protein